MNYLFFDTESANCYGNVYKMCELGYLLTDDAFNLIPGSKKDILMSPGRGREARFNLTGRKGGRDLQLAHTESEYYAAKPFMEFYDNIKFLLDQPNTMIFLWASGNDIQALLDQCSRFRLPLLSFVSYDVQALFKYVFPEYQGMPSLDKAMDYLGLPRENIVSHRPDDDSLMTAMILKALSEKAGKSISALIGVCPGCRYESIPAYQEMKRRHAEKAALKAKIAKNKQKLAPYHAELNELFSSPIPEDAPREKRFSVSLEMKMHVDETLESIKKWIGAGYYLKRNLNSQYLVAYDEEERKRLSETLDTTQLTILLKEEFDAIVSQ